MSTGTSLLRRLVGAADAIAAPHGIDRYLEQVVPTWSSTEVRGKVVAVDRSTSGSILLTIKPNGLWSGFRAGQYTQLSVEVDGVRHTRCYSMASSARRTDVFELGIRAHDHGLVSRHLFLHARPGMVVGLTPAAGDFTLAGEPGARPERIVLVSGGSGITPVVSMLRTLADEGHTGAVAFVHYARRPDAMLLRHEVAAIAAAHPNVRVLRGYDAGLPGPNGEDGAAQGELTGLFSIDHLVAADERWAEAETYVCGPAPLMDAVRRAHEDAGAAARFHTEAFTLSQVVAEAGTVTGTLSFTSGTRVENDGRPILEQAEAAGLTPTSGCRMGICHTCTRSLTCGTVRDVTSGELTTTDPTQAPVEIRICVNAPVADVTVEL